MSNQNYIELKVWQVSFDSWEISCAIKGTLPGTLTQKAILKLHDNCVTLEWFPYYGTCRNYHTTRAGSHILMTMTERGSQLLSPANERKKKWPARSNSRQDKVLIFPSVTFDLLCSWLARWVSQANIFALKWKVNIVTSNYEFNSFTNLNTLFFLFSLRSHGW